MDDRDNCYDIVVTTVRRARTGNGRTAAAAAVATPRLRGLSAVEVGKIK